MKKIVSLDSSTTTAIIVVIVSLGLTFWISKKKNTKNIDHDGNGNDNDNDNSDSQGRRTRSITFNSAVMLNSFPPEVNVPPPISNICYFIPPSSCPSVVEQLATMFGESLYQYDRFNITLHKIDIC